MNRRLWLLLILLVLPLQVTAKGTSSIVLTMKNDAVPVRGGTVTLYEITQWGCDPTWDAAELAEYAEENQIPGITKEIDSDGKTIFDDLNAGQYLLVQKVPPEGYFPMQPFLVGLPMTINGETITDIPAEPKIERIPGDERLPQTGQLHWPAWIMSGTGILLVAAGIGLQRKE